MDPMVDNPGSEEVWVQATKREPAQHAGGFEEVSWHVWTMGGFDAFTKMKKLRMEDVRRDNWFLERLSKSLFLGWVVKVERSEDRFWGNETKDTEQSV